MLSDEDKKEFEQAMKNVRPLDSHQSPRPKIKKPIKIRPKTSQKEALPPAPAYYVHPNQDPYGQTPWVGAEDELEFNRSGLQQRAIQQLKRGQLPIERKVDLHGFTAEEALDLLHTTLDNCQHANQRLLLVIHGKGHYSQGNTPILKNVLNQWLRQSPMVLAFHSALPKHGGNGAMYVLIKTKQ
jgi:DNA-nicking Smr family endonuclease